MILDIPKPIVMKKIFTLLAVCLVSIYTQAQDYEKSYELSNTETGIKEYVARDYISLKPGFSYKASGDNHFTARIDECLLFPPTDATYGTPEGAAGSSPSSGGVVGSIPGSFTVSPTGAATYTIPIEVPKGINGMEPKLSLNYNSQLGNNIVGWGWNISGSSVISRSNKTSYFNGELRSVKWNTSDQLSLDGAKLIKIGTISSNTYEYRKENDDQSKIVAYEIGSKGAKYFEVTTKNGLTFKYEPIFYSKNQESETVEVIEGFLSDDSERPLDPLRPLNSPQLINQGGTSGSWVEINRIVSATSQNPVYKNWILTRVTDNFGNYIDYHYSNNSEQTRSSENRSPYDYSVDYPMQIGYSDSRGYTITKSSTSISTNERISYVTYGNKNTEFGKVSFGYSSSRAEPSTLYIAGNPEKFTYRLSNVRVYSNNVQLKRYDLSFVSGTDRLESIKVTGQNDEDYNSTVFQYGSDTESIYHREISIPRPNLYENITDKAFIPKDLNGDGLTDLVAVFIYDMPTGPGSVTYKQAYQTFLANIDTHNNVTFTGGQTYLDGNLGTDFLSFVGEIGGLETMHIENLHSKSIVVPFLDKTDYWCNMKFLFISENLEMGAPLKTSTNDAPLNAVRDFNNDGYEDLFYLEQKQFNGYYPAKIIFNKPGSSKFREFAPKDLNFNLSSKPKKLFINDYNADGLNDIFIVTESGYYFYKNNGGEDNTDGYTEVSFSKVKNSSLFNGSYSRIESGDFNGDLLPDFLLNEHCNNVWYFAINNGDGSFTKRRLSAITAVEESYTEKNDGRDQVLIMDFNQDGKSDVVIVEADYKKEDDMWSSPWGVFRSSYVAWYESTGTNVTLASKIVTNQEDYSYKKHTCTGDFNGDGQVDILSYGANHTTKDKDTNLHLNFSPKTINDSRLITSITNGLGNKAYLEYQPLTCSSVYSKSPVSYDNVTEIQMPLYVLKQKRETNSGGSTERISYSYTNALIHPGGRGFLGFETSEAVNSSTNNKSETKLKLNTSYNILLPYYTLNSNNGTTVNKLTTDISIESIEDGKRFVTKPKWRKNEDFQSGITELVTFNTYDEYLNPTKVTTTYANSPVKKVKEVQYVKKGAWCDNVPELVTTTKYNALGEQVRVQKYDYDSKGNVTFSYDDYQDDNQVKTHYYNYDDYGNPWNIDVTANGETRTASATYNTSDGRFLESKTDALGFTTTYEYDEVAGLLDSEKDNLGNEIIYEYDGFGRLVKATYPDGTYSVKSLQWAGGDGPDGAVYYSYEETSGQSPVWTWYDGQGRELRREDYGFKDDKKIWVDKDYYSETGRLKTVSKPYFAEGSKEPAESYTYDDEGRVLTKTTPMGITTMEYDGLTTTMTSPRSVKVKTVNAAGQTVSSTVDGRSVTFSYYPSGKVKESKPQDGKAVEMVYDLQGNRIKITDPDAGIVENTYNGFGEVLTEKYTMGSGDDERTVTTSYTYDESGRLEKEDRNGTITDYRYNGSTGFLESVKRPDHELTYVYDEGSDKSLGRPTTINEKIDGKTFTSRTNYDAFGREQKHTYPSGFYVRNTYTKYSHLEEVKGSNGKSIWKGEVANALGQFKKTKKGGQTTTFGYDEKDRVESIYSPDIIDHFYIFNDKGNLKSREDRLTSHKEIFTYDKHQLKSWKIEQNGNVARTFSMDYDEHGNITGKSDLGYEMQYNDERPHAISGIKGNPSLISDQEQIITYTDFKKIATVSEGDKRLELLYGVDEQRRKAIFKSNGDITLTRFYLGDYEEEETPDGKKRKIHYLSGGDGLSAIYVEEDGNSNFYYAYTDHLGSLTVLTDKDGNLKELQAFDPWGNRRNPSDWTSLITTPVSNITGRGYTMHEHLDGFALINMNGRVYDPQIARFLSPDPQLQAPGYWLNYNRYGYALNNPLIYTDPSGEFFWIIPNIGWSKSGGLSIGLSFVVGLPGGLSAQAGIGYSFGASDAYGYLGATAAMNTVYASYSLSSGGSVGYTAGLSSFSGLPVSTNFATVGTNYNITHDSWSGNVSAWTVDRNGLSFNPSLSVMIYPEHTTNFVRGKEFRSNEAVFQDFVRAKNYQGALDYFGFKGTYNPKYFNGGGDPAVIHGKTGDIVYNTTAFDGSFDKLRFVNDHERWHYRRVTRTNRFQKSGNSVAKEEYENYIRNYKRQGLYLKHKIPLGKYINGYGSAAGIDPNTFIPYTNLAPAPWWHGIYSIRRLW